MSVGYIHTVGDLDNLFWVMDDSCSVEKARKKTVEGILQEKAKKDDLKVVSHAYGGFTTISVLNEDVVGGVLNESSHKKRVYEQAKKNSSGEFVRPLDELRTSIERTDSKLHYAVISVGKNDFSINLRNFWRLISEFSDTQKRLLRIVNQIVQLREKGVKPILILQYRTDANNDPRRVYSTLGILGCCVVTIHVVALALLTAPIWAMASVISFGSAMLLGVGGAVLLYSTRKIAPLSVTKDVAAGYGIGMSMFNALLKSFYLPVLRYAKKEKIPLLDLSNTFNPYDKLYCEGIEPNESGSKLIAEGVYHIVKNHNFKGDSLVYAKSDENETYTAKPNDPETWQVAHPA